MPIDSLTQRLTERLERTLDGSGAPSPIGPFAEQIALGDRLQGLSRLGEDAPRKDDPPGTVVGANLVAMPGTGASVGDVVGAVAVLSPTQDQKDAMDASTSTPSGANPWATVADVGVGGGGDVMGPASSVTDQIATYADASGKIIKDSGVGVADIGSNSAHRTGNGADHADVATNTTHSTGNGADHADVASNNAHRTNTANPHGTDIGNLGSGTLAELNAAVTDATLDTSTASRPPSGAASGDLAGTYPSPTVVVASETVAGKIEIATQVETDAGTDDTRAVTPLKLANFSGLNGPDMFRAMTVNDAIFPATDPASASNRNAHPIGAFDDTTDEALVFSGVLSHDYSGGNVTIDIDWVAATATTGDVVWGAEIERLNAGGTDIDADSFDTQQTATDTTNGTSGIITRTSITLTNAQADGWAAGDAFRLRLERVATDGSDDMVGDAQVLRIVGRQ